LNKYLMGLLTAPLAALGFAPAAVGLSLPVPPPPVAPPAVSAPPAVPPSLPALSLPAPPPGTPVSLPAAPVGVPTAPGAPSPDVPPVLTVTDPAGLPISSDPTAPLSDQLTDQLFGQSGAGDSFQCRVDSGAWQSCSGLEAILANGSHGIDVQRTNASGQPAETKSATVTITRSQPQTAAAPASKRSKTLTVGFLVAPKVTSPATASKQQRAAVARCGAQRKTKAARSRCISAAKRTPQAYVRWKQSTAATAAVIITRIVNGTKTSQGCRAGGRAASKDQSCRTHKLIAFLPTAGRAGLNRMALSVKVRRQMTPGRYAFTIGARTLDQQQMVFKSVRASIR
jgi:hypothetical protein